MDAELQKSALECHICLAPPTDPVATLCGHLFCWPCLYRWLQGQPKPCPVCRAPVRSVIPIYGSHGEGGSVPPRPSPPLQQIITMDATANCERALRELRAALAAERARVTGLLRERRYLTASRDYWRSRNFVLAGERARRHDQETEVHFLTSSRVHSGGPAPQADDLHPS
jgi:hypothetical protein